LQNNVVVPPPNVFGGPTSQSFAYDDLYRLAHAEGTFQFSPTKTHTYTMDMGYDTIHNIASKNQLDTIVQPSLQAVTQKKTSYNFAYAYNPSGATSIQPHAPNHIGLRTYSYDLDGNQTGWTHDTNGTRRTITWDEENRIQAVFDNGQEKDYKYDDQGQRMIKRGPQGETVYVNQFFTQRPGANGTKHVYAGTTRIASKLVLQGTPNSNPNGTTPVEKDIFFYHPDHIGSTNYVTDLNGKLFEHLEYFPFGESWVEENTNQQRTPYLFSAKELDEETGLYYFGARYYDPRTSVWQSPDLLLGKYLPPVSSDVQALVNRGVFGPKNLGLYTYAGNNPVVFRDPDGLAPTKVHGEMAVVSATRAGFSEVAAREIAKANMSVDTSGKVTMEAGEPPQAHPFKAALTTTSFWKSYFDNPAHATGDIKTMPKSSQHIDDLVDKAVDAAISGDINTARTLLGQATHTAEDQPFHKGIGPIRHAIQSIGAFLVRVFTLGLYDPDFNPDKVTGEKRTAAIENDINKVFTPFSERLRERASSPEEAAKKEREVKGQE
jgi:RHS repeat-associated protein